MAFVHSQGRMVLRQNSKDLDLTAWARRLGTPLYVYDGNAVLDRFRLLKECLPPNTSIHYAMKANNHPALLRLMSREAQAGVDVVSGGEVDRALLGGFRAEQIVFSGVGKTREEIAKALKIRVKQINVESLPELERVAEVARELKTSAAIAFRVNPDVDIETHPYIKTGFRDNKFGIDPSQVGACIEFCLRHKELSLIGLAMHIGSQILDVKGLAEAWRRVKEMFLDMQRQVPGIVNLDLGGGWGIDYQEEGQSDFDRIREFSQVLKDTIGEIKANLMVEPGRILVARSGVLLTEVQYLKKTPFKNFLIVDTGIHHLIRPALYQAVHRIEALEARGDRAQIECEVVGPLCESSDVLGRKRHLPEMKPGEILAIRDAGAYGASMSSLYNLRAPAQEVVFADAEVIHP